MEHPSLTLTPELSKRKLTWLQTNSVQHEDGLGRHDAVLARRRLLRGVKKLFSVGVRFGLFFSVAVIEVSTVSRLGQGGRGGFHTSPLFLFHH